MALAPCRTMNILSEIRTDHLNIRRVLGQLERSSNRQVGAREKGFRKLHSLLTTHYAVEEETLYRLLAKDIEIRSDILERYEEHHLVKFLLEEMKNLSVRDEHWDAKLSVLRDTIERHFETEETELFMCARKVVSDGQVMKEMGLSYRILFRERIPKPVEFPLTHGERRPYEMPRF